MAEVVWSAPAAADLEEIADYISLDNLSAAEKLIQRVIRRTRQLEKPPKSGPVLVDFPGARYRSILVEPCRIFYRIDGSTVYILRVLRTERIIRPGFFEDEE